MIIIIVVFIQLYFTSMRPAQLKWPYTRTNRRVLIQDKIWFIPEIKEDPLKLEKDSFIFPGWDHPELFGNQNPINIEYCSGNGHWIVDKAEQNPLINWVAIERKFDRVRKIWSKMQNRKINNLIIICGEGHHATNFYIPAKSVGDIFINFPDPWPKTRHHKNRIVQHAFVQELRRIMKIDSVLTMVTDDEDFSKWTIKILSTSEGFDLKNHTTEWPTYGRSYFEQLWREQGKTIRYHQYVKTV